MTEFKKLTDKLYSYIKSEHAFRSGLDWFFTNGYPEGCYRWLIDYGYPEDFAEAEAEQCVRAYYFN